MHYVICFALCIFFAGSSFAAPVITAARTDTPPVIDGRLDEAIWQTPAPITEFVGLDEQERQPTECWIAYDDDTLYLAFKVYERDMDALRAEVTDRDGDVLSEDAIELLLDPARTDFSFMQLAFNALGTQYDAAGDHVGLSGSWNGIWRVRTARADDHWTAEVAIPFAAMSLSRAVGEELGLTIARHSAAGRENATVTAVAVTADLSPFYFELGVLDWGQGVVGSNTLTVAVRNTGDTERTARLRLHVPRHSPTASAYNIDHTLEPLAPGQSVEVQLNYILPIIGTHHLTLQAFDGEREVASTGRAMAISPLAEFGIFKSFYRDDAVVTYRVNVPEEELGRHTIRARLRRQDTDRFLGEKRTAALTKATGELRFDTGDLERGQYIIEAAILDADGGDLLSQTLHFPQLRDDSVTDRMITVRQSDNMLILEGEPHFPIGIYEAPGTEIAMQRLVEAGFNLCRMPGAPSEHITTLLDRTFALGLRMWMSIGGNLEFTGNVEEKEKRLGELVQYVGRHPGLLCWESYDEPAWGGRDADGFYEGYSFLRALDQHRPIWTNHAPRNTIAELAYFNRATDISGADIYPIPEPVTQSDLPNKTISVVGDETVKNMIAVNYEKPIFMVLQGFGWGELSRRRGVDAKVVLPTFHESRFMAYQSIVHGANGVLYWGTSFTDKPSPFYSELKSLVSELAILHDVLAAEQAPEGQRARLVAPENGVRLLHKLHGGRHYIIVVNETPERQTAQVQVPGLGAGQLKRLFEDRQVTVDNTGTTRFALSGYDVALLSDDMEMVDRRKDFSDEWRNAPPAATTEEMVEPGNEIVNPGFEFDSSGDLLPDRWTPHVPLTVILSEESRSGRYALEFTGIGGSATPLVVNRGLSLQADREYRLSAWMKADPEEDIEARMYVEWTREGTFYPKVHPWTSGTGEWQQLELTFTATPDPRGAAYVVLQVRGSGKVLFDDLRLELVE